MNGLRAVAIGLDRLLAGVEAAAIVVLVCVLTAITFAQVAARYVLGDPLIWSEEAARYLFVWVSMIGAALAIREGGHFGLDLLIRRAPALKPVLGPAVTVVTSNPVVAEVCSMPGVFRNDIIRFPHHLVGPGEAGTRRQLNDCGEVALVLLRYEAGAHL